MLALEASSEENETGLGVGVAVAAAVRPAVWEIQKRNQLGIRVNIDKFLLTRSACGVLKCHSSSLLVDRTVSM